MKLGEIVGQPSAVKILKRSVASRRVAHAWMFYGPDGVGKRTAAYAFAQTINCLHPEGEDACGRCEPCKRISKEADIDVHFFAPDPQRKTYHIKEDIREQIVPEAYLGPVYQKRKILILSDVDRLNMECANALLKPIEEPGPSVVFILLASDPSGVISTIRSRCLQVPFRTLRADEAALLVERKTGRKPDAGQLELACLLAGGRVADLQAFLESASLVEIGEKLAFLSSALSSAIEFMSPSRFASEMKAFSVLFHQELKKEKTNEHARVEASLAVLLEKLKAPGAGLEERAALLASHGIWLGDVLEIFLEAQRALRGNANVDLTLEAAFLRTKAAWGRRSAVGAAV